MKKYEELLEEAYNNVNEDRKLLKDTLSELKNSAKDDPTLLPVVARTAVIVSDALTKCNAQLVELVKVESKKNPKGEGDSFSSEEADSMFDEIRNDSNQGEN